MPAKVFFDLLLPPSLMLALTKSIEKLRFLFPKLITSVVLYVLSQVQYDIQRSVYHCYPQKFRTYRLREAEIPKCVSISLHASPSLNVPNYPASRQGKSQAGMMRIVGTGEENPFF